MADDVATTAKCLVNYSASENGIRVSAAIDGLLKGQASQAVHVMNLLHGLQEKPASTSPPANNPRAPDPIVGTRLIASAK